MVHDLVCTEELLCSLTLRSPVKAHAENPRLAPAPAPAQLQRCLTQILTIRMPFNTSPLTPVHEHWPSNQSGSPMPPASSCSDPGTHAVAGMMAKHRALGTVTAPIQGLVNLKEKSIFLHLYSCLSTYLFFLCLSF